MNRIVVIEDDPAILSGLEATLRSESYDVLTAGNGEDGYHLVQEQQPDLVILELMLPKMWTLPREGIVMMSPGSRGGSRSSAAFASIAARS